MRAASLALALLLPLVAPIISAQAQEDSGDEESPSPSPTLCPTPHPTPTPTPVPPPPPLASIVYTGGSGGVGSGLYIPENSTRLTNLAKAEAITLPELASFHGALAQGPYLLFGSSLTLSEGLTLLESKDIQCDAPTAVEAIRSDHDVVVFDGPGNPELLPWLIGEREAFQRRTCQGGGAKAVLLQPASQAGLPDWSLAEFEVRQALKGVATVTETEGSWPFTLVGAPIQDRARVVAQIKSLRSEDPGLLYVDSGSFVDGASSALDGAASLHRDLGFDTLVRLAPDALAPGFQELAFGAYAFFRDIQGRDLPYVATNWESEDSDLDLPSYILRDVNTPGGPRTLAFLGIIDPELMKRIPALKAEGLTLTSPIQAISDALQAIEDSGERPHAVILLTTAGVMSLEEIRRRSRGVDLLIGDPSLATLRVDAREVDLRPLNREEKGAPITLSMDGLARLDLTLGGRGGALSGYTLSPLLTPATLPGDPTVRARVTGVRAQLYPAIESPLIAPTRVGATGGAPPLPFTQAEWESMVCEAVRQRTGADIVLLSALPKPPKQPGILTEMLVADALRGIDPLELHRVLGDDLPWVLDRAYGQVPLACGVTLGKSAKIQGRGLVDDRMYWVVTTELTRETTALSGILAQSHSKRVLDQPAFGTLENGEGQALTLQGAVRNQLGQILEEVEDPAEVLPRLFEIAEAYRPAQWVLKVRRVALEIEGFEGMETDVFEAVPETLATSPSSLTVGSRGDVALEYDSAGIYGDVRARGTYQSIRVAGGETEELADDWRLSASISLPTLRFPEEAKFQAMPYAEVLYDSEFSAFEGDDGFLYPIQSDLSGTLGLSASRWKFVRRLRLGIFANRAMAQLDEKPTEYGATLSAETRHSPGGSTSLRTYWDVQYFGKTQNDDPSDLRLRASGEIRLTLPLSTYLGGSIYAQGLAIRGRVPETAEFGTAYTVGVSLDAWGAWDLARLRGPDFR